MHYLMLNKNIGLFWIGTKLGLINQHYSTPVYDINITPTLMDDLLICFPLQWRIQSNETKCNRYGSGNGNETPLWTPEQVCEQH